MKRQSLKEWCQYAGPMGPGLWALEGLVEALARILDERQRVAEQPYRFEKPAPKVRKKKFWEHANDPGNSKFD